jgi:hypothetical protein
MVRSNGIYRRDFVPIEEFPESGWEGKKSLKTLQQRGEKDGSDGNYHHAQSERRNKRQCLCGRNSQVLKDAEVGPPAA